MFFLRTDYKYGDPAEQPEPIDAGLCAELDKFLDEIPSSIRDGHHGGGNWANLYTGPHRYLFFMAVMYAVREVTNGNPAAVTTTMLRSAASNSKNWPTRGILLQRSGQNFEDRGSDAGLPIPLDQRSWIDL